MNKNYFINLVKKYCKDNHINFLCFKCRNIINLYLDKKLDKCEYFKIIAYHSFIFRKYHYYTFKRISLINDDLTK